MNDVNALRNAMYHTNRTMAKLRDALDAKLKGGEIKASDITGPIASTIRDTEIYFLDLEDGHAGFYNPVENIIVINRNLTEAEQIMTFVHESRHVYQHQIGYMKDSYYELEDKALYFLCPSEIDARNHEMYITNLHVNAVTIQDLEKCKPPVHLIERYFGEYIEF